MFFFCARKIAGGGEFLRHLAKQIFAVDMTPLSRRKAEIKPLKITWYMTKTTQDLKNETFPRIFKHCGCDFFDAKCYKRLVCFPASLLPFKWRHSMIISYSWSGGCCKGAEQKLDHQHSSLRSSTTPLFETFPNEKGSHMICAKLMRKQASLATKQLKFGQKGIKMSSHCQQDAV